MKIPMALAMVTTLTACTFGDRNAAPGPAFDAALGSQQQRCGLPGAGASYEAYEICMANAEIDYYTARKAGGERMRLLAGKHRDLVANGAAADGGRHRGQDVATAYRTRRDFIVASADAEPGGICSDAQNEAAVKRGDTLLMLGDIIAGPAPTQTKCRTSGGTTNCTTN